MKKTSSLFALLVLILTTPMAWSEPEIVFEEDRVVAEGITPFGETVWLGVSRDRPSWRTRVVHRRNVITDSEGQGRVEYELEGGVPQHSIWAVVDLQSGEVAVAVPESYSLRKPEVPAAVFHHTGMGSVELMGTSFRRADIVVVRPGIGAWAVRASDGSENDIDGGQDGLIWIEPEGMEPLIDGREAPVCLEPGDIVVMMDPDHLRYDVQRVALENQS
jgi:hypothetical protein